MPQTLQQFYDLKDQVYQGDSSWAKIILHLDRIAGKHNLDCGGIYPLSSIHQSPLKKAASTPLASTPLASSPHASTPPASTIWSPPEKPKLVVAKTLVSPQAQFFDDEEDTTQVLRKRKRNKGMSVKDYEQLSAEEDNKFDNSPPPEFDPTEDILERTADGVGTVDDSGSASGSPPSSPASIEVGSGSSGNEEADKQEDKEEEDDDEEEEEEAEEEDKKAAVKVGAQEKAAAPKPCAGKLRKASAVAKTKASEKPVRSSARVKKLAKKKEKKKVLNTRNKWFCT